MGEDGYLLMYGSAIRLALADFRHVHKHYRALEKERDELYHRKNKQVHGPKLSRLNEVIHNYESANRFLFSKDGLKRFIEESGLPISIDYVRKIALCEEVPNFYGKMEGLV